MLRQLKALWVLGWAFLAKVLLSPFVRDKGGGEWLARLREEQLAPTPPKAWTRFERASRCIGCGLCDVVAIDDVSTSSWLLGSGREPANAPLVVERTAALRVHAQEIARICPARVGIDDVAAIISDNAKLLE